MELSLEQRFSQPVVSKKLQKFNFKIQFEKKKRFLPGFFLVVREFKTLRTAALELELYTY